MMTRPRTLSESGFLAAAARAWTLLRQWRATRLPCSRFIPLAAVISLAAGLGMPFDVHAWMGRGLVAFLLILLFRLWDDLIDRDRDRMQHPHRVLARAGDDGAMTVTCGALGVAVASMLWIVQGTAALVGLILAGAMLALWYRCHRARGIAHAHVLLLKYPLFALLLANPPVHLWPLGAALAAIYCALCSFELIGDEPVTPIVVALLAAHGSVLVLAGWGGRFDLPGACAVLTAGAACAAALLRRPSAWSGHRYLPLLAAIIVLVRLSIGDAA